MKSVSVIVTVYNTEKYLTDCLDSIINQSFEEYEVILINDGSTDSSESICKRYEAEYENIKYIRTENCGPGAARNRGIAISEGEYICFIDSDDYILPEFLQELYTKIKNQRLDCVCCGAVYKTSHISEEVHHIYGDSVLEREQIESEIIASLLNGSKNSTGLSQCWNKMYRADIIKGESIFQDERLTFAEDWLFNIKFFKAAEKIGFIDLCLYVYVRRQSSLSTSFKSKDILNGVYISEDLHELFPDRYKRIDRDMEFVKTQWWSIKRAGRVGGAKQLQAHIRWLYNNETIIEACENINAEDFLSIQLRKQTKRGYVLYCLLAYCIGLIPITKHSISRLIKRLN